MSPMQPVHAALALLVAIALDEVAAPAIAVTLPVELELRLEVATLAPQIARSIGIATVNGSGPGGHLHSLTLAAGQLVGTSLVAVTDPAAFPITGVRLGVSNAPGAVAETTGGSVRGAIGLAGVDTVCLFGTTGACGAPLANLIVPLTPIGVGGAAVTTVAVAITILGAPWTNATAAIGAVTRMAAGAHGPASGTSSTAQPGGTLQLVTPVYITTNIGASAVIPIFATLTIHFVPEPATLGLLCLGIAALGWAGRRRSA